MNGECEICHEHSLDCTCEVDNFSKKVIKGMLLDFIIDSINDLAPEVSKSISMENAIDFIDRWVDKRFKEK